MTTRWKAVALAFIFVFSSFAVQLPPSKALADSAPSGAGTASNPYIIDERADLDWMSLNFDTIKDKIFKQTADIDMGTSFFIPIGNLQYSYVSGQFSGTYDGQSFKIKNLVINGDLQYTGLFRINGGTVKNLILENVSITNSSTLSSRCTGGIAGSNSGTIQSCSVSGDIYSTFNDYSSNLGGIVGSNAGKVYDCCCTATLHDNNPSYGISGGIISKSDNTNSDIQRCYFAGGIAGGSLQKGAIIGNRYQGNVSGNVYLSTLGLPAIGCDNDAGGAASNRGSTSASDAQMKQQATYSSLGWNFATVWKISEGTDYPRFITTPGKPTNLSTFSGTNYITVSWTAAAMASAYQLFVGTSPGVYGAPITVTGTTKNVTGLTDGHTYYFAVKALHIDEMGALSDEVSAVAHTTVGNTFVKTANLDYGNCIDKVIYVGWYDFTEVGALKFDLAGHSGEVTSAKLYLYVSTADSTGTDGAFDVYGSDDNEWTHDVGPATHYASPVLSNVHGLPGGWNSLDITSYVRDKMQAGSSALTVFLQGHENTVNNDIAFYNIDDPNYAAYQPFIEVTLLSDDARLSSIQIGGANLAGFSPDTYTYSYVAPHGTDLSTLSFASTANDAGATMGAWSYSAAQKKWTLTVTAQNGSTKTYTVNVSTLLNTNAKLSGISVGGGGVPFFASDTYDYHYSVAHGTDVAALVLTSVTEDPAATQGDWTYNAATKTWSVVVTAEDGTTTATYTVNVVVMPSTDATLKNIKIGGADLPGFAPGTLNYTYNVPHGTNAATLALTSEANDDGATQDGWSYDSAMKRWRNSVKAQDLTHINVYTVTINELPGTHATLSSITVDGAALSGFAPGTLNYNYNVAHGTDISKLLLAATATDDDATVGAWSYDAAGKKWSVTVSSGDGLATQTYAVTVNELPSTDATLKSISVEGAALPAFAPGTLDYTYTVPHGTDGSALALASEVNDHMAAQGSWGWNAAQKKWSVTVTAEDGVTKKIYTVSVHELPSTDATLKSITVNGAALPSFVPGTLDYTYDVVHGTDASALAMAGVANDDGASVGAWSYDAAQKKWSVTVTAEDGLAALTYTVTAHELPSTDATLKSLKVGGMVIAGFAPGTLAYTYYVAHGADGSALSLSGEANDHMAVQSAWGWNAVDKKWSVTVTAEDGVTEKTYVVSVLELPSADAMLKSIKVNGADLPGFAPATMNYDYYVAHGTNIAGLVFTCEAADAGAAVGTWTYIAAQHKWVVNVTAEDRASTASYTVTVHELPSTDATLKGIKVNGAALPGFAPGTSTYTYNAPYGTNPAALTLTCEANDHAAVTGAWAYDPAAKAWSVTVTAEDGVTAMTYAVTVNVLPNTDASLSAIRVNGAALPGFAPATLSYVYKVAPGTDGSALTLASDTTDAAATQSAWAWSAAAGKWSVTVTAADGASKKTYSVAIVEYSSDATLKFIRMDGVNLPGFSPAVTGYTHIVAYGTDVSDIVMSAAATNPDAVVGAWTYTVSLKKWSVTVTAEDGMTTKTYRVTFAYASTATPEPDYTPEPTDSPEPTESPEPEMTPGPTDTPEPETAQPTAAPVTTEPAATTPSVTASATPGETNGMFAVAFAVTDGQSPVAGATVTVDGSSKTTGADGKAVFDLGAGTHSYAAAKDGYQSTSGSVTVDQGTGAVCIVLAPEGKVVLHAEDGSGAPGGGDGTEPNSPVLIADNGALQGNDVKLVVDKTEATSGDRYAVQQKEGGNYDIVGLFDIYLLAGSQKVQPGAPVRVGVPVPAGFEGHSLKIVRINDDGTVTEFETTVQGGMLFFTTDHFSKYAIIDAGMAKPAFQWWLWALLAFAAIALAALAVALIVRARHKAGRA